jgi:hypothetical protein
MLNNDIIFFLAKDNEVSSFYKYDNKKLRALNQFTNTIPDFRANLLIQNKEGGFSSYQSDYPSRMISKKGNIISPISSLTNSSADKNLVFIKNIYEKPIAENFKVHFVDLKNKRVVFEKNILTNKTNEIEIQKHFLKPDIFLYTSDYLGIPMYVSIKKNHISFEHTHPPHEYIFSDDKFLTINKVKSEINEIIDKENC